MNLDFTPDKSYTSIDEKGNITLTTEKLIDKVFTPEEQELFYHDIKDCSIFIKEVEVLNEINSNPVAKQYVKRNPDELNFEQPFIDTQYIYNSLKDNEYLQQKAKKTKLLSDKIKAQTEYIKQTKVIELAIKNYKHIDPTPRKQIIALVIATDTTYKYCMDNSKDIGIYLKN